MIEQLFDDPIQFGIYAVASIVVIVILWLIFIWFTKIRPLKPKLEADWRSDCEFHGQAIIDGTKITFKNVRDFFCLTTTDFDINCVDEITVDSE